MGWIIELRSPSPTRAPYQIVTLDHEFKQGRIHLIGDETQARFFNFEDILMELLTVLLLSPRRGLLLHACAASQEGTGWVFAGQSGAGKSTMARLWREAPQVNLLSDERVILRQVQGEFRAYGTPWYSDARAASPESARLEGIFLLRHGAQNTARQLEPAEAVTRLLACSFPPYWDAQGMENALGFLGELCQSVPCYELGFLPQPEVVNYIREKQWTRCS
ncbi:MAG: hypothetical protein JXB15_08220 [Anaerolineales bacterium]|nr:hypothetical protein [Anaerolineales bacterium]